MMATKSAAFTPAATPPEGVLVNFENPPSNAPIIYIVMTTCLVIVTLLVAVRLYTRAFITKPLWWDDCKYGYSCALELDPWFMLCFHSFRVR